MPKSPDVETYIERHDTRTPSKLSGPKVKTPPSDGGGMDGYPDDVKRVSTDQYGYEVQRSGPGEELFIPSETSDPRTDY